MILVCYENLSSAEAALKNLAKKEILGHKLEISYFYTETQTCDQNYYNITVMSKEI
jgi:hypothetical protein